MNGLLLALHSALADESAMDHDVELLRPRLGLGAFAGVDDASTTPLRRARTFWVLQYENEPVIYVLDGELYGAAVGKRFCLHRRSARWSECTAGRAAPPVGATQPG